ncbi:HTH-type transcriptional repressor NagR [Fusobacterium sp. DD29]|uniref:GntR family transcriptional regulator n=1 Tax=unclassified Fusobacterium TaxID=2648384 RepID=UPI001B8AB7E9|nr:MULTISPECIES: GntR family transcriptional regulator [unclassified Fusobacterium]MBR8701628.1 HTH-type transcriptional repressor NagR [Fusobacterium sp. DD45]MBR8711409.1 HTH-type transcriptional repressor NagR [Fusobacterium sp. DD28]MBR8749848.1 HTH-type transcriptional repressor NagR [Fusobacterium sp. DD29]MBR8751962.1 HTH-type transcriptional repressor NagR [Fusobacterium sp. DD26]MBR8762090.1 HTH-type transcriptional repressor NagR [Fusobacterium sp. DD25]
MELKKDKIPLYVQLAKRIMSEIEKKGLHEDTKLPAEREYSEEYKVSRSTVRQAISYLEKKGYIYKIQGSGTFVSSRRLKQRLLTFYSFTEEMKKQGKRPDTKLISFNRKEAGQKLITELHLSKSDQVFEIVRLRLADNKEVMFEKTYLPCNKFNNLTKYDLENSPLYDVLQNKYKITFTKAVERFSVDKSDNIIAKSLLIDKNDSIMKLQRWTYSGSEIVEYTVSAIKGDMFEFEVELKSE